MLDGLKLAVTPEGRPLADSATALLNPPATAVVMVDVPLLPCGTVTATGAAVTVKLGATLAVTVSETEVVAVTPPPVPVISMVDVPAVALLLTVSVSVEDPDPGAGMLAGLKLAVTPEGSPLAASAMALLKPPEMDPVMMDVPLAPCFTVRDMGFGASEKFGLVVKVKHCVRLPVAGLPSLGGNGAPLV